MFGSNSIPHSFLRALNGVLVLLLQSTHCFTNLCGLSGCPKIWFFLMLSAFSRLKPTFGKSVDTCIGCTRAKIARNVYCPFEPPNITPSADLEFHSQVADEHRLSTSPALCPDLSNFPCRQLGTIEYFLERDPDLALQNSMYFRSSMFLDILSNLTSRSWYSWSLYSWSQADRWHPFHRSPPDNCDTFLCCSFVYLCLPLLSPANSFQTPCPSLLRYLRVSEFWPDFPHAGRISSI